MLGRGLDLYEALCWNPCNLSREKDAVVDSIEGLRVVDASAIPLISTANLHTTVYAFAERSTDLIKKDLRDS